MQFHEFYTLWYSRLKHFAREYVISEEDAEDIVQEVFTELYEKYDTLNHHTNLIAYTFTITRNRCIDLLRKRIREQESAKRIQEEYLLTLHMKFHSLEILENDLFRENNLEEVIERALNTLPERCRLIFIKHKIEGKKQQEIARELNLTPKTVENQISIAYRKLRRELKNYLPLLLFLLS